MMQVEEERNFFKATFIVVNVVTEALRTVFKTEWDKRYPAKAWNDDQVSLNNFKLIEKTPFNQISYDNYQKLLTVGGQRNKWDVTLLNYVLLFTKSLDIKRRNPNMYTLVKSLVEKRNEIFHKAGWFMTSQDFMTFCQNIESDLRGLGAPCARYLNEITTMKSRNFHLTPDEKIILIQALKNEKKKPNWYNIISFLVLIVACVCVYVGHVELNKVTKEIEDVRETMQLPSKDEYNIATEIIHSSKFRNKYLLMEILGFVFIIISLIYILRNLYKIKQEVTAVRKAHDHKTNEYIDVFKQAIHAARYRSRYLFVEIIGFILFFALFVYIWNRVTVVEEQFLPWNVTPDFPDRLQPDFFQGRQDIIDDTAQDIVGGTVLTMFTGQPGIGKTVTSVVVGKQLRDKYGFTVCLVEVRGMIDVKMVTQRIFKAFNGNYREFTEEEFDDFFRRRLKQKTLLIIDNAEDILASSILIKDTTQLILRMVNFNKNMHVLLTSRKQIGSIGDINIKIKTVRALEIKESVAILTSNSVCPTLDLDSAEEIARRCGGVPLLLTIAGKQIRQDLRHVKVPKKQQEVITAFLGDLQQQNVLVTLNKESEPDERSMIKCIDVLISRLKPDLQDTYFSLSVFEVSFSDEAANEIVPNSTEKIPDLLDYNILNDVIMNKDQTLQRYTMHPLLQEFSKWKLNLSPMSQNMTKETEKRYFTFFIDAMQQISRAFFSTMPGESMEKFSEDQSNFQKTLMRGLEVETLFESYYEMIVCAADLLLLGFDDKLISTFFDKAAEEAKQKNKTTKYMALLYLQGDRGDVYFYHHKDKYNKIQKLVDIEVEIITKANLKIDKVATRETAYALCVQGRVFALYSSRPGWSKEAEKIDDYQKGTEKIKQALEILDRLGLLHDKAIVYCLLGLVRKNRRQYHEAIEAYKKGLGILNALYGEHALIGAVHFDIGYMYYKLGSDDFLNGKNEFLKSYHVYEKTLGDHRRTASAVFHAGECLNFHGDLKESLPYFLNAFEIQLRISPRDRDIAETLMSIAEVNYKLGSYQEAVTYYEKCLKIITYPGVMSTPKHREIAYTYKGLANSQLKLHLAEDAKDNFITALNIFKYVFEQHNRCEHDIIEIERILQDIEK